MQSLLPLIHVRAVDSLHRWSAYVAFAYMWHIDPSCDTYYSYLL
jgi:hypothetical protein